ncbi:MAG: tetratricopeptide repeat protein [Rhodobacteraceae bacterium]|nr:tetratricopeptide repeat protein [Paracoccaceae bacterium]
MSETDSFIEEVTEEVRRDKLFGYVKKYGWIAVVVVFGAVGTTGYLEWQKSKRTAAAQMTGDLVVAALELDSPRARAEALGKIAPNSGSADVLVSLRRSAELLTDGDKTAAIDVLDQIADSDADPIYRELASLKVLMLRAGEMDAEKRLANLDALAQPGKPFRPLALEQLAVLAIEQGDTAQALTILGDVMADSQSTSALRSRAEQIIISLGGEVPESAELLSGQ